MKHFTYPLKVRGDLKNAGVEGLPREGASLQVDDLQVGLEREPRQLLPAWGI
jgi:hypothetical protein